MQRARSSPQAGMQNARELCMRRLMLRLQQTARWQGACRLAWGWPSKSAWAAYKGKSPRSLSGQHSLRLSNTRLAFKTCSPQKSPRHHAALCYIAPWRPSQKYCQEFVPFHQLFPCDLPSWKDAHKLPQTIFFLNLGTRKAASSPWFCVSVSPRDLSHLSSTGVSKREFAYTMLGPSCSCVHVRIGISFLVPISTKNESGTQFHRIRTWKNMPVAILHDLFSSWNIQQVWSIATQVKIKSWKASALTLWSQRAWSA